MLNNINELRGVRMSILHDLDDICSVYGVTKRQDHHKVMKEYIRLYYETKKECPSIYKIRALNIITLGKLHLYLQKEYGVRELNKHNGRNLEDYTK